MNTIGVFAGRGDVILAMGLAFLVGLLLAWWIRGIATSWTQRRLKRRIADLEAQLSQIRRQ